ncbi:MAG: MarR family transcriptional regulator [Gammaproteobacteria bacterium]|nr:MarR family transcriptional regulator [Gammaproteobacteria bacterium]MXW44965.1 MarR family transcriptional regulator [Gammaproteobacteria bacterium]MYD02553.1 MarR family transcriptional regulator [Gammaproteobacteria bacterium]MYI25332.1 MarR family transcriptional regulator [Gammaproteobacteria bacterium]
MDKPTVFDLVLESLPEKAHHRRAWLGLLRCFSSIDRVLMRRFSEKFNSSLPRYDVLTALALSPNGLTMGELASSLMVTKGNITGVVSRLKQDGLVRKITSSSDRRIQSVTLSAEGRALWDAMHADYDETVSEILSGQPTEDLDALSEMLENTRVAVQSKTRTG